MIDADLVAWTYSEGGVPIATIAEWHEMPKTEIAKCLPLGEFLKAWDSELTPQEKAQLIDTFIQKKNAFIKEARAVLPREELSRDRTYKRLMEMFPNN
jgi:hypothetical protein